MNFLFSLTTAKNIKLFNSPYHNKKNHFMLGFAHMCRTNFQVEPKHEFKTFAWNGWIIDL
jgi:hypothetical protein